MSKSAIVTGSTSGIGLGIANSLAAAGFNIMLNGFGDAAEIEKIKNEVASKHGVKTAYSPADISKPADIRKMVADTVEAFGSVDVLVNNAGIQFTANTEDFPDEKWDQIIAINLSGAFHGAKAVIPHFKKQGWGRIINIASAHGLVGSTHKVAYVAAKHGIIGMTKVVAIEAANDGVTCNAICPGWVLTPLVQKQVDARAAEHKISNEEAKRELLAEKEPSLKFTTPEELGALAVFLCSDAAANVRGQAWAMDGGWTAQ
ncbi:MAG: 3-hydroxybutyrate dehydrogenase [Burkholderiaceae bacterium]|nr:3-hydroxybutyrate dehydrogenase [Burkholderiaceae bacterium]